MNTSISITGTRSLNHSLHYRSAVFAILIHIACIIIILAGLKTSHASISMKQTPSLIVSLISEPASTMPQTPPATIMPPATTAAPNPNKSEIKPRVIPAKKIVPTVTKSSKAHVSPPVQVALVAPTILPVASSAPVVASIVDASLLGIRPEYPRFSRQNHQEGLVVCKVTISPDGTIAKADIVHSSGFDLLDTAALKALQQAQFQAAINNGQTITSSKLIAFRFKLNN